MGARVTLGTRTERQRFLLTGSVTIGADEVQVEQELETRLQEVNEMYLEEVWRFIARIDDRERPLIDGWDGRLVVQMIGVAASREGRVARI